MANNENNNNAAGSGSWNSPQSLGLIVIQRHKNVLRQPDSNLAQHHLGRNRSSLAATIYRRFQRHHSPAYPNGEFPFVNFFSRTALKTSNDADVFLSPAASLQRVAIDTPITANAGTHISQPSDAMVQRYARITSTHQSSSSEFAMSKPLASETASNPVLPPAAISEKTRMHRKIGDSGEHLNFNSNRPSNTAQNLTASQESAVPERGQLSTSIHEAQAPQTDNPSSSRVETHTTLPNALALKTGIPMTGISRKNLPAAEHLFKPLTGRDTSFGFPVGNYRIGRISTGIRRQLVGRQLQKESISTASAENSAAKTVSLESSSPETRNNPGTEAGLNAVSLDSRPDSDGEIRVSRNTISAENGRTDAFSSADHSSIQRAVNRNDGKGNTDMTANHLSPSSFRHFSPLIAKVSQFDHPFVTTPANSTASSVNRKLTSGVQGAQQAPEHSDQGPTRLQGPIQRAINRNVSLSATNNADVKSENPVVNVKPLLQTQSENTTLQFTREHAPGTSIDLGTTDQSEPQQTIPDQYPGQRLSHASEQHAMRRQSGAFPNQHDFKGERTEFYGSSLSAGLDLKVVSPVQRKLSLPSSNSEISAPTLSVKSFTPEHDLISNRALTPAADLDSGLSTSGFSSNSAIQTRVHRDQSLQNNHNPEILNSHTSVQRAVDRQNTDLSWLMPKPGIWNRGPGMPILAGGTKNPFHNPVINIDSVASGQQRISAKGENPDLSTSEPQSNRSGHQHVSLIVSSYHPHEAYGKPMPSNTLGYLLMRSAMISPQKTTHRLQRLSDQPPGPIQSLFRRAVARKSDHTWHGMAARPAETADLNVLALSPKASPFSSGGEGLMPGTARSSQDERGEPSSVDRAIRDSIMQLPLAQPYAVQRNPASSPEHAASGEKSDTLQRQDVNNTVSPPTQATPLLTGLTDDASGTGKTDSNALSTDDVVDKVWRKLMRKLVSEQERMGGSSRWA